MNTVNLYTWSNKKEKELFNQFDIEVDDRDYSPEEIQNLAIKAQSGIMNCSSKEIPTFQMELSRFFDMASHIMR